MAVRAVLATAHPRDKAACARRVAADWFAGRFSLVERGTPLPDQGDPARPARPELTDPKNVPRRRLHTVHGRVALLHAIAHIEFNAIDLAFDLVARFASDPRIPEPERTGFISDWIRVGDDEARHFILVEERLNALGAHYGDLPAHNGLWDAARATADDLAARLAVAPLVLEARGLDVTPAMIERLKSADDSESAAILTTIYTEEVAHVAAGAKWFRTVCRTEQVDAKSRFHELVETRFKGQLKMPFNEAAREKAGLPADFYRPLAG
ncbi:ferritin-like domain-containing protein [Maricaulis sp. D1M11]|uniref:ferritin-like domain-containing protein n=1 Tax=Maricaulis sp. D1M11 TaxID=3076117 RepID=UPI0039B636B0